MKKSSSQIGILRSSLEEFSCTLIFHRKKDPLSLSWVFLCHKLWAQSWVCNSWHWFFRKGWRVGSGTKQRFPSMRVVITTNHSAKEMVIIKRKVFLKLSPLLKAGLSFCVTAESLCIAFTHSLTVITSSLHNEVHSLQKIGIPRAGVDPALPDRTSFPKHALTSSSLCLLLYSTVSQLEFITGCTLGQSRVSPQQGTFSVGCAWRALSLLDQLSGEKNLHLKRMCWAPISASGESR